MIKSYNDYEPSIAQNVYISENVSIVGNVTLGNYVNIWFGSVLRADMHYIKIGDKTNIQDNSVIHVTAKISPTNIGNSVTIGHAAIIHGCTIDDGALIGMGSIIMNGAKIGRGAVVGAGAVVTENMSVPDLGLVVGLPGKVIKTLPDDTYEKNVKWAKKYVQLAAIHKSEND